MKKCVGLLFVVTIFGCTHLKQAHLSYENGDYDDVISACQTAIEADSTDAEAYHLLGQAYYAKGDLEQANSTISVAVDLEPQSLVFRNSLIKVYIAIGNKNIKTKDYAHAIIEYRNALILDPENASIIEMGADSDSVQFKLDQIEACRQQAKEVYSSGQIELLKKNFEKAKRIFEQALEIKPDYPDAQYGLHIATGNILYKKGGMTELWDAIVEYGYASSIYPNLSEPHFLSAQAYEKKDRDEFENAIREYELAATVEPNSEYCKKGAQKAEELKARKKKLDDFWGK